MTHLHDASEQALERELAKRRAKHTMPDPSSAPNWAQVRAILVDGITSAVDSGRWDDDLKQYVWEAVAEAVYGPGFWDWRNAQPW